MTPLLLSGCSQVAFNRVQPDLFVYTKEQQTAVEAEVVGGACPASTEMLKDYMVVRDQIRGELITDMSK